MIVKNEISCLGACLESIRGADEVIIVDTGSTDGTQDLARSHGAIVYEGQEYAWRDDFAFSRNQSLDLCTGDWILIIDADEVLESGGIEKIKGIIESAESISAIAVYCLTVSASNHSQAHRSIRLFKREQNTRWLGRVHNYLTITTGTYSTLKITYGYSKAHNDDPDRALRILSAVVADNPLCKRERYYLAREYWYRKDYLSAVFHYEKYLSVASWGPEIADAYLMKARCHYSLGQTHEAQQSCLRAIQTNADFREALLFMAALSGPKNSAH
jgi:glycosyltransferase involved in cell wall biosynthesis